MAGINFDFTTGVLPGAITFTRASIGTYNSSGNILTTASNDVARFNYVAGVSNLLIEPSATNLLPQSNTFSDSVWLKFGGNVITAAVFVSPDGTNNGWSIAATGSIGGFYQPIIFSAVPYTLSLWAKLITGTTNMQFSIGPVSSFVNPTSTLARLSTTLTPSAAPDNCAVRLNGATGTDGFYGAQLETSSVATSYIPTTTAAVTRAADSATFTIPSGINQLVYTFDDNSTQTVAVSPGSYTIPTTLARPNIKSVVGRYAFDFTGGSLPAGMTFTRPSIGTYVNNAGTLITAGNDVARFNYVSGVANLLIEPTATNLLSQSNGFGSAPWTQYSGGVLTAAQFISPDGSNNGWSLNNPAGFGGRYQFPINFVIAPYTMSIWAKRITGTDPIRLRLISTATTVDCATTAVLTRVFATMTPPSTGNDTIYVYMPDAATNGTNGIYGCQLETGSVMTSYIPTTTAAVTRAADSAVFTIPSGVNALLYTFDDGSTQQVSVTAGSYTIPTTLSRPNIKSIQGLGGFDFTGGTLPPGITFTRASIGTYFDGGNILRTATNNVARMNYVSGVSCLLIEGSATNLLIWSNDFSQWGSLNSPVVTAAQFVSPDGTTNGWSMTGGTGFGMITRSNVTVSAIPYTISIWGKFIISTAPLALGMPNAAITNTPATSSLARMPITLTPSPGGTGNCAIQVIGAAGTNGIYGCQLEAGSVMTSYIPTLGGTVTRAVDQATFTIPTGVTQLTYTFDDNSTQTVSAAPGSYTIPVNLSRPNIKSIAWVTTAPITPTPSPARVGAFQSFGLAANIPLQLTAGGTYRLYILNTGPGNLFVSTGNTPGPNATVMVIPPLKAAPMTTTAGAIWLSSDQDSTVSIAAMPR